MPLALAVQRPVRLERAPRRWRPAARLVPAAQIWLMSLYASRAQIPAWSVLDDARCESARLNVVHAWACIFALPHTKASTRKLSIVPALKRTAALQEVRLPGLRHEPGACLGDARIRV